MDDSSAEKRVRKRCRWNRDIWRVKNLTVRNLRAENPIVATRGVQYGPVLPSPSLLPSIAGTSILQSFGQASLTYDITYSAGFTGPPQLQALFLTINNYNSIYLLNLPGSNQTINFVANMVNQFTATPTQTPTAAVLPTDPSTMMSLFGETLQFLLAPYTATIAGVNSPSVPPGQIVFTVTPVNSFSQLPRFWFLYIFLRNPV